MSLGEHQIETCHIDITQYLCEDGQVGYTISRRGTATLSTQVGLMELAKQAIIKEFEEGERDR